MKPLPPGNLKRVISSSRSTQPDNSETARDNNTTKSSTSTKKDITINGIQYVSINAHAIINHHSHVHTKRDKDKIIHYHSHKRSNKGSLVDREVNG